MAPSKDRGGSQLERFRSYLHWLAEQIANREGIFKVLDWR